MAMSSESDSAVHDPGAAAERTLLAWRRTALLLGVASVVGARVLADSVGPAAFAVGLLGVALAVAAHGHASARYRQGRTHTGSGDGVVVASTRRLGAMSLATAMVALIATLVVWNLH